LFSPNTPKKIVIQNHTKLLKFTLDHDKPAFWYNVALISFAIIAMILTWTVMSAGFSSSDATKRVLEKAMKDSTNALQIVGKMHGAADIQNNEVIVTTTPLSATSVGFPIDPQNVRIAYKVIKDGSHAVTYENIYAGILDKSYNSLNDALVAAKERGFIGINPLDDLQKPDTTSAFMYWVIDQNSDGHIENNEVANLVIIYADKERPATSEYIRIQIINDDGVLLDLEKTVPHISDSFVSFGGKIRN
jgi:flagellin FlaB